MKKRIAMLILFVAMLGIVGIGFALSRIIPELLDEANNEPMHLELEQNPQQAFSVNCNWYPACPVNSEASCITIEDLHKRREING